MDNAYLTNLKKRLGTVSKQVENDFSSLSETQLNWRPAPNAWGVGLCLAHLIAANTSYFSQFDTLLAGTKESTFWEKLPVLPRFWGGLLLSSVQPNPKQKLRAPAIFQPKWRNAPPDIVSQFVAQQNELSQYFQKLDCFDHKKIIITSPVAKPITYSLFDTCNIITAHEERHLQQAQRVLAAPDFPK